jgi:hypothetical protein
MVPMRLSETDEIAAELYLVPPARFVAAREQVARQARAAGHRDLARELHALRRPTLSAWLVNLLTRHERGRLQQLFAVGRELRQAQTRLDAEQLRRLPGQQQDMIADLLDAAGRHAADAGVRLTEAALSEVEATLQAGLVDLAAASAVMSGHLVRPMSHAGFGPLPQVHPAGSPAAPAASAAPVPAPVPVPEPQPAPEQLTGWRLWPVDDELRRRRERSSAPTAPTPPPADPPNGRHAPAATALVRPNGQQHDQSAPPPPADAAEGVRRAEAELADAASAHWQREHDLAEAEAAMQDVKDRLETLDQQRMQLRREKVTAEQDLATARAAQRAALRAVNDARRALEAAEKRLQPPPDRPPTPDDPE